MVKPCFATIYDNFKGITEAKQEIKISRPDIKSRAHGREAFETCYIFPKFVVLQLDSGNKGADSIRVRHLGKSNDFKRACDSKSWSQEIKVPDNEQYFLGMREGVIFTHSADSFGNLGTVWVYSDKNGNQLYEANYNASQDFTVSFQSNAIALEYYKQLKLNCSLFELGKSCWEKIAKDNGLPNKKRLGPPDCGEAYKRIDFKLNPSLRKEPNVVQIFAKVKIDDVQKPKVQFLDDRAKCNATP